MDVGVFVFECIVSFDEYVTFELFEYGLSPLFYVVSAIWVPCECYEVVPGIAGLDLADLFETLWAFGPLGGVFVHDVHVVVCPLELFSWCLL